MDPNQNYLDNINMELGLSQSYPTPPVEQQNFSYPIPPMSFGGGVGYNPSYGIPPRVPHITNVPMASGESSSSIPIVTQFPGGHEVAPGVEVSNEDPTSAEPSNTTSSKRERELTGECWQIFEPIKEGRKTIGGKCLICGKVYTYKSSSGTGTFLKHKKQHDKKGDTIPEGSRGTSLVQTQFGTGGGYFKYDPAKVRKNFIKYIVRSEKPLSMAYDPFFEEFVRESFHPQYKKSYWKQMNDELFANFWERRGDLYDEFKNVKYKVSLTSDIWSAGKHDKSYCTVTAHWITEDNNFGTWFLNKRLLAFRELEYPHDAESIFRFVLSIVEEYHCRDKIFSIGFDNASNCNAAIRLLTNTLKPIMDGKFFHSKCACHILNLIVKAGMEVDPIQKLIGKYKDALRYVDSSIRKKQYFAELCRSMGIKKTKIPWDVDTRWNSTYRLLRKTTHLRPALERHLSSTQQGQEFLLTQNEWRTLELMIPFLEIFYTATVRLSASYTPTSIALLEELVTISDWYQCQLTELTEDDILWYSLEPMKAKFLKYWHEIPPITIVACCLDPRWKTNNTANFLSTIRQNMGLEMGDAFQEVNTLFESVYKIYERRHNEARVASSSNMPPPTNPSSRGRSTMSRIQSILRKTSDHSPSTSTPRATEMQMFANSGSDYGNIRLDDENFNILQFWHQVKGVFPILASMACDILAVPVSTVASESCFSAANRVLTDKRTRLGEKVFEALVLLKDWYDAESRFQDKSWMYQIDREETDASSSNVTVEGMPEGETSQSHEEQDPFASYSNPYMYNYEEYGYMYNNMQGDFF